MVSLKKLNKSQKLSLTWLAVSIGLLLVFVVFLYPKLKEKIQEKQDSEPNQEPNDKPGSSFTYSLRSFFAKAYSHTDRNPTEAGLVTAVAAHETGNFKSDIFLNNNNAFGMRMPSQRETTAVGERNGYALYNTVHESIRDFYLWFGYHKRSPADFASAKALVSFMRYYMYFEAPLATYTKAVKSWYDVLVARDLA